MMGSLSAKLAMIALLSWAPVTGVQADDEEPPRATLFSCGTDPEGDRTFLNLSGIELDYDSFTDLRFEQRADDETIVYSFPPAGIDTKTAFLFSHSDGPEGYLVSIRWVDAGTDYVYYSLNIPPNPDEADDMGGADAGLAISRGGQLVDSISCVERPYMFIGYMRDAMSCDMQNPYGEGACGEDPVMRNVPLEVGRLGLPR